MPGAATKKYRNLPTRAAQVEQTVFVTTSVQNNSSQTTFSMRRVDTGDLDSDVEDLSLRASILTTAGHRTINSVTPRLPSGLTPTTRSQPLRNTSPSPQDSRRPNRTESRDKGPVSPRATPDRDRASNAGQPVPTRSGSSSSSGSQEYFSYPPSPNSSLPSSPHEPSREIPSKDLLPVAPSLAQSAQPHTPAPNSAGVNFEPPEPNGVPSRPVLVVIQSPDDKATGIAPFGLLTPASTPLAERVDAPPQLLQPRNDREPSPVSFVKKAASGHSNPHEPPRVDIEPPSPKHKSRTNAKQRNPARLCQGKRDDGFPCGSWARKGDEENKGYCHHHRSQMPDQSELASLRSETNASVGLQTKDLGTVLAQSGTNVNEPVVLAKTPDATVVETSQTGFIQGETSDLASGTGLDQETAQNEYVPTYMTGTARETLLAKMYKPQDLIEEGYVYVCMVTERVEKKSKSVDRIGKRSEHHMYVKVGCAKNPKTRAKNWNGECPVNKFELHGIWPKYEGTPEGLTPNGRDFGHPCLYKYLLEGLIKHELEYLAQSSAHLPEEERRTAPEPEECPCKTPGVVHQEIYAIARYGVEDKGGKNDKKLWDMIDEIVQSTSLVGRLPNEVWIHILECLPAPAILHCRQLCRKIKYIIDHTARLQYPIELFATGHVDGGPSNPLSTAARLAQLRAIDRGWRTLDWKSHLHYPWNGDCPNYELAGGVFARGRSTLPDAGQPDVDDFHHFTAAIDVIVFPPRDGERGEEVKSWSHEQVGLLVHDFTIAPEQDLVVLVGHRHEGAVEEPIPIHLRALSSNTPHPLATLPVLFAHPQPTDVFISDFTIQIYDSLLGILFWGAHAFHLMIWDWCSGEIIVDYAAPAGIHFDDFTFLSSSSFLIPSSSAAGAALRVYSFAHLLPPNHPSLSSAEHTSPSDTASDTTSKSSSDVSTSNPSRRHRINYDHIPLGRAPHHLEFDNSGRRVAPACWTPPRPDGVVRSFHIGNYVFSVSNLEDWRESAGSSRSGSEAGTSSSGVNGSGGSEGRGGSGHGGGGGGMASPAGLNGLSRRPQLCSLLKFPKPRREWNVGIMTCRVDPLPRFGMDQVRRCRSQGKGKARDDTPGETGTEEEEEDEGDETRLAPVRAFHADPDKAIIALSSGLVPVRTGVFAGVVYLDEGSLAWEEGGGDEGDADGGDEQPAGEPPVGEDLSPTQPEPVQPPPPPPTTTTTSHHAPTSTHEPPPPLTTLVPWIDLHMPPSSLPAPADPPIMSVFDHSSAGSGHTPIQIQIHDAIIGEDGVPIGVAGGYPTEPAAPATGQAGPSTGPGTAAGQAAAGVAPVQSTGAVAGPAPQGAPAPGQTAPNSVLTGPDAPVPAPFTTALPFPAVPQVAEDDPNVDDMERLYFNLFVHCRALRRFAGEEEGSTGIGATLFEQAVRPDEARADTSKPSGRIRPYRPKVYDWDDWAPPITRLLTRMPMPAWACISHGQRFATLGAGGAGMSDVGGTGVGAVVGGVAGIAGTAAGANMPGPANANAILNPNIPDPNWLVDGGPGGTNVKRPVRVLDFNPYGVRRSKGKDVEGCRNRVTVVDEPSILPAGRYWQADVRSELPYREVVTREEMLLSGVMIDGERVLGMRSDERGNVSEMHVMQV